MSFLSTYAQDFLNAYGILKDSNDALIERMSGGEVKVGAETAFGTRPAMGIEVVCLAFSVELHLKELHRVMSGKIPRGHNIAKLFRTLPAAVQEEVCSHRAIARYGWNDSQFENELLAISDGFEKWRYAYESVALWYNSYFAEVLIEASQFVATSKGSSI